MDAAKLSSVDALAWEKYSLSSFCPAIGVRPIRAYAALVLIPYRLASCEAVACAADSASASAFWPLPKSMVMMFTTLTFTP